MPTDARKRPRFEEQVPVNMTESELSKVVEAAFLKQLHGAETERERPLVGFVLIIEVDNEGFAIARFDEAVGVAVELLKERFTLDEPDDVVGESLALKVGYRSGLGGGEVSRVPEDKDCRIL